MKKWIKKVLPNKIIRKYIELKTKNERIEFQKSIKGDDVFCPICNSTFKIFGTFGLIKRYNALCYNCKSLERHRLLFLFFKERFELFPPQNRTIKLLHFAPEKSLYDFFSKHPNLEYFPCDLIPEKFDFGKKIEVNKVDITDISFNDNFFDIILCSHVLEHVPDDKQAMNELYRVMSKNGSGIFQVPIDYSLPTTYEDLSITLPEDREKAFGQHDHVRLYGRDYKNRLEKVGFNVNEIDFCSRFSTHDIFKYGLNKAEMIYLCNKN